MQGCLVKVKSVYKEILPLDSDSVIVEKVFKANVQRLYDTLKVIDIESIREVAREISKAGGDLL
jgi:DNA-binding MurR/RpiR family transcriptional regulator